MSQTAWKGLTNWLLSKLLSSWRLYSDPDCHLFRASTHAGVGFAYAADFESVLLFTSNPLTHISESDPNKAPWFIKMEFAGILILISYQFPI